jgi:hypothetical protein
MTFRQYFSNCLRNGTAVGTKSQQSDMGIIYCNKYNVKCEACVCVKDRLDE